MFGSLFNSYIFLFFLFTVSFNRLSLSSSHQVSDSDQLTVRHRILKQPAVRQHSLADVALDLPINAQKSQQRDLKRILSEPLFNHLREKLLKIRRKRATSEPVSLEAIRQRKLSLQNPVTFQIGEQASTTKGLRKGYSLDSAEGTDGKAKIPPQNTKSSSSRNIDEMPEGEGVVVKASSDSEMLSAHPPSGELEERHDSHSNIGECRNVFVSPGE